MGMLVELENGQVVLENVISLKKFPPELRKLGKYLLESPKPVTLTQACQELGLSVDSVYVSIHRAKKKGNDFQDFINQEANNILHKNKANVLRALVDGAVSESHNDRKLYFQLTGDLKETTNINVGTLAIGINITGVTPQDQDRTAGTIDVEPVIPKGK